MKIVIQRQKILAFFGALFLFFLFSGHVRAAYAAESHASIDWSTFNCYGVDIGFGTPDVFLSFDEQYVYAGANDQYNSDYSNDWSTPLYVEASQDGAYAEALADGQGLYSHSMVSSGDAWSYSDAYGSFTVSGTGVVVLTVDYNMDTNINGGPGVLDAWADSSVYMEMDNMGEFMASAPSQPGIDGAMKMGESYGYSEYDDYIYQGLGDPDQSVSGTMITALFFTDGAIGNFWIGTDTDAYADASGNTVPIPSALLLFASGLVAVTGIRKRTAQK